MDFGAFGPVTTLESGIVVPCGRPDLGALREGMALAHPNKIRDILERLRRRQGTDEVEWREAEIRVWLTGEPLGQHRHEFGGPGECFIGCGGGSLLTRDGMTPHLPVRHQFLPHDTWWMVRMGDGLSHTFAFNGVLPERLPDDAVGVLFSASVDTFQAGVNTFDDFLVANEKNG
jgi:hypothetical protein